MKVPSYERDPYLVELDTRIVEAGASDDRPFVETADTLFYPEGGGQPADHGTICGVEVVDVQSTDGGVVHFLKQPLEVGPATLRLDWPRRWDHMQQHTAQHVLTAVADTRFAWPTTAFHLGAEHSDVELDVARIDAAQLTELEEAVAAEVRAARPVTSRRVGADELQHLDVRTRGLPEGHSGSIRLVEIEGLDLNTCGGTHVRSTTEIGTVSLIGTESLRGGTRLFFVAGDRVRRRMAAHEARNARLRTLLGAADHELPDLVQLRLDREKRLARDNRKLAAELAGALATALAMRTDPTVTGHWETMDMAFLQALARRLVELAPAKAALLSAGSTDDGCFLVAAGAESGCDPAKVGARIAEVLQGRGGGKGAIFQGKAERLDRLAQAERLLQEMMSG